MSSEQLSTKEDFTQYASSMRSRVSTVSIIQDVTILVYTDPLFEDLDDRDFRDLTLEILEDAEVL